jgi:hypothetical protein
MLDSVGEDVLFDILELTAGFLFSGRMGRPQKSNKCYTNCEYAHLSG